MVKKICIGVSVALAIILFVIGIYIDKNSKFEGRTEGKDSALKVELIPIKDEQYLVNSVIIGWMNGEYEAEKLYDSYKNDFGRLDTPSPVTIKFNIENVSDNDTVSSVAVYLSETKNFENAKKFDIEIHKREFQIFNLKTGQKYYYRVIVKTKIGEEALAESTFETAKSPRLIKIDDVRNVRDIGGYKTVDGKIVKQGLYYRGTELGGIMQPKYKITEEGINTFVDELGIKTEMDLRSQTEGGANLSSSISQKFYTFNFMYGEIFEPKAKKPLKNIFSDLASTQNYPLYLHCTYGSDRTGTITYLLQALLGVSENDCYSEWELSTFFNGGSHKEEMLQFVEDMKKLDGDTLQEKTENFLMSTGVTKSEIENIKKIFLE